jgi:hypothetical protein
VLCLQLTTRPQYSPPYRLNVTAESPFCSLFAAGVVSRCVAFVPQSPLVVPLPFLSCHCRRQNTLSSLQGN